MSDLTPQWKFFRALTRSSDRSPWMRANIRAAMQQAQYSDELRREGDDWAVNVAKLLEDKK